MWPYGQTPPLEKCEQPDLKHSQAMLQNDLCPQNSPEGGRVLPTGPRTIPFRDSQPKTKEREKSLSRGNVTHVYSRPRHVSTYAGGDFRDCSRVLFAPTVRERKERLLAVYYSS